MARCNAEVIGDTSSDRLKSCQIKKGKNLVGRSRLNFPTLELIAQVKAVGFADIDENVIEMKMEHDHCNQSAPCDVWTS